jgi:hypothetical protein
MRPRTHVLEDISRNHVKSFFSACGWSVNDLHKDYGEDLIIQIFQNALATPLFFFVQVKATDQLDKIYSKRTKAFSIRLPTTALIRWQSSPIPTLLVLYDAKREEAYWEYCQFYLDFLKIKTANLERRKTFIVSVKKENKLGDSSIDEIKMIADKRMGAFERNRELKREIEKVFLNSYGMKVDLGFPNNVLMLPCGKFEPEASGDSQFFFLGKLAKMLAQIPNFGEQQINELLEGKVAKCIDAIKLLEAGNALHLKDEKSGKILKTYTTLDEWRYDYQRGRCQIDSDYVIGEI